MNVNTISVVIGIALGLLAMITGFVKAIAKVTHIYDVIVQLNGTMEQLIKRVDTIDQRIYDNAIRNSPRR